MREMQGQESETRTPVPASPAGNERGVVLVLALVMLALLAILGAWALDTSSTELKIAGNSRKTQNAFYAAEAALACAVNPNTLSSAYVSTGATGSATKWSQVISIGATTANMTVDYLGSGALPAGSIYDADLDVNGTPRFHGFYFAVNTEGNAGDNAVVAVESVVVQVAGN
jgi:hypothetical protein